MTLCIVTVSNKTIDVNGHMKCHEIGLDLIDMDSIKGFNAAGYLYKSASSLNQHRANDQVQVHDQIREVIPLTGLSPPLSMCYRQINIYDS